MKKNSTPEALAARRQTFIDKAISVHRDKFDYSEVEYVDSGTDVVIICPIHGRTKQQPKNHLRSNGCGMCARDKVTASMVLPWDTVLNRFRDAHGDRYSYENAKYVGMFKPITITCKTHGDFNMLVVNHADGQGCVLCHREKTKASSKDRSSVRRQCERARHEGLNRPDFIHINSMWKPTR